MLRLAIHVEGFCEQDFVREILTPHLARFEIQLTPIVIQTSRTPTGEKHRGGGVSLKTVTNDLRRIVGNFDRVTTLYDLYGFGDRAKDESADDLANRIAGAAGNPSNLTAYVQQYEYETLFLAAPNAVADHFAAIGTGNAAAIAEAIRRVVDEADGPEAVNDGPATAPSKRLDDWAARMAGLRYLKDTKRRHALPIARAVTLPAMRDHCPRFAKWIATLESFGSRPGAA